MTLPLYQVDAFTAEAFRGNPAAVCLLDVPRPDAWMLALAQEMNLSETAFLLPEGDGWRLRWFTPLREIELCGHATLASAHVLWESGRLAPGATARFFTHSGLLCASQLAEDWIELDFPAREVEKGDPPAGMVEALGVQPVWSGHFNHRYLLELNSEGQVRRAAPDFTLLKGVECRGVIITARATTAGLDFVSRFFATYAGINEDPVTGSAHTLLIPYWAAKLGRPVMTAYQASARGGMLRLRLAGERVGIAGQAVTVFNAELLV